jgi:hypothetical protein
MAKQFMEENGINWWTVWHSESTDINPIEMVWNQMKRNIARSEPKTENELLQCIQKFWTEEMTTEQCNLCIDHIYNVVPVCIPMKGAAKNVHQLIPFSSINCFAMFDRCFGSLSF